MASIISWQRGVRPRPLGEDCSTRIEAARVGADVGPPPPELLRYRPDGRLLCQAVTTGQPVPLRELEAATALTSPDQSARATMSLENSAEL